MVCAHRHARVQLAITAFPRSCCFATQRPNTVCQPTNLVHIREQRQLKPFHRRCAGANRPGPRRRWWGWRLHVAAIAVDVVVTPVGGPAQQLGTLSGAFVGRSSLHIVRRHVAHRAGRAIPAALAAQVDLGGSSADPRTIEAADAHRVAVVERLGIPCFVFATQAVQLSVSSSSSSSSRTTLRHHHNEAPPPSPANHTGNGTRYTDKHLNGGTPPHHTHARTHTRTRARGYM